MNARDPLQPIQKDEAEALGRFAERVWDDEIVPQITRYIEVPAKSPIVRCRLAAARLHRRTWCATPAAWVERQQVARPEARGDPPRRPHAGDLLRRAGDPARRQRRRRGDDLPLRPPRQAARVQRLEERLRPVDAALRERPALRPRRRRRRLRDLRRDHRDPVARQAGHRPAALRRPRSRPARRAARPTCRSTSMRCASGSARSASSSASTAAPATTTSSGSRPACAATSPAR